MIEGIAAEGVTQACNAEGTRYCPADDESRARDRKPCIGTSYLCNGDSVFHVDNGVIGFKIDAADTGRLLNTRVDGLGMSGSSDCGDHLEGKSHPAATLCGYGGAAVRAFAFAGSSNFIVNRASATNLSSMSGPADAYAVLTDSREIRLVDATSRGTQGGWGRLHAVGGPHGPAYATGFYSARTAPISRLVGAADLPGYAYGSYFVHGLSEGAGVPATCRTNRKGRGTSSRPAEGGRRLAPTSRPEGRREGTPG